ncbi:MAG: universal stress protein A [Methylobacter sp.]|nr:MAG: universal stress protein A [Methylobacter sp.]PPD04914.1 MAG: universal stress protein A [Methylobacter sp.]PPD32537.1 MAG: universal stress protein A [Methylomonas sp.]
MQDYKHILLAADFSGHGEEVAARAQDLAAKFQARLSIIHVVDYLPLANVDYDTIVPFDVDVTQELMAAAKKKLVKLAEKLAVPDDRQWLEMGSPKLEIVRVAQEQGADLIVVGSHGRHGLALLLGSTANGVLHHATCDVLAVRLRDD